MRKNLISGEIWILDQVDLKKKIELIYINLEENVSFIYLFFWLLLFLNFKLQDNDRYYKSYTKILIPVHLVNELSLFY